MWSSAGYGLGVMAGLFAIPFYTSILGIEQFGLLTLLSSVTAPFGVLNVGVAQSTTKFIAEYHASRELDRAAALFRTTLLLNSLIAVVGAAALWPLADPISTRIFNIPDHLHFEAATAIRLAGLTWAFGQIVATFQAVSLGFQQFRFVALGQALQSALTYFGGIVVLQRWSHLHCLLLWNLLVAAGATLAWSLMVRKSFPHSGIYPSWDKGSAALSFHFSIWQTFNSLMGTLSNHTDRVLLGVLQSPSAVGFYGIAQTVQSRVVGLAWSGLSTLFPAASSASRTEGASEQIILEKGWMISILVGVVYSTVFVLGGELLTLWVGATISDRALPLLRTLLASALIGLPSAVVYQYMLGRGLTKISAVGNLVTSIVTIGVSAALIPVYGLKGAAWGGLLGLALTRPAYHIWVIRRVFSGSVRPVKSFVLLYGVTLSTSMAAGVGIVLHTMCLRMMGNNYGFLISFVVTPVLSLLAILLMELFFGRGDLLIHFATEAVRFVNQPRVAKKSVSAADIGTQEFRERNLNEVHRD